MNIETALTPSAPVRTTGGMILGSIETGKTVASANYFKTQLARTTTEGEQR